MTRDDTILPGLIALAVALWPGATLAHTAGSSDPADPSSATAVLVFRSAVSRDYTAPDEPLNWRLLFDAKGEFRPEHTVRVRKPGSDSGGGPGESGAGHGHGAKPARR